MIRHLKKFFTIIQNNFLLMSLILTPAIIVVLLVIYKNENSGIPLDTADLVMNQSSVGTSENQLPVPEHKVIRNDKHTDKKSGEAERLNLPLSLIKAETRGKNAPYAVIRNINTGTDRLVRNGSVIFNAVITEITDNSVLLQRGVAEQVLHISTREVSVTEDGVEVIEHNTPPYSAEEITRRYNYDSDVREVMGLMAQIGFAPGQDTAENEGVIITRIETNSVFERIGLEVDDIILSIDDKRIESVDDSFEIYESLRTSDEGSILIRRNNREETLMYRADYL